MSELDIRQIMDILPHRFPMLLIDRITELEPMKRAVGYKNVTMNEAFFQGHFPGMPVMPGVLMIEAMAQLGGAVVLSVQEFAGKVPYLAGIQKLRFRRPVVPGDCLMMETTMLRAKRNMGLVAGRATVNGVLVCSGELMYSIVADPSPFKFDATILHQ